jgi:hypothetical protein
VRSKRGGAPSFNSRVRGRYGGWDKRFPLPRLDRARQKWAVAHESKTVVSHAALPAIPARFSRYQKHHHHPADRSKSNLCVLRRVCGRVTFECSDLCKFPDSSCQVLVRTVSTKYGRRVSHLFRSGLVSATRSRRCSPPPRRRATCGPPGEAYRDRLRRTGRQYREKGYAELDEDAPPPRAGAARRRFRPGVVVKQQARGGSTKPT